MIRIILKEFEGTWKGWLIVMILIQKESEQFEQMILDDFSSLSKLSAKTIPVTRVSNRYAEVQV